MIFCKEDSSPIVIISPNSANQQWVYMNYKEMFRFFLKYNTSFNVWVFVIYGLLLSFIYALYSHNVRITLISLIKTLCMIVSTIVTYMNIEYRKIDTLLCNLYTSANILLSKEPTTDFLPQWQNQKNYLVVFFFLWHIHQLCMECSSWTQSIFVNKT